jgi:hypothetical protein
MIRRLSFSFVTLFICTAVAAWLGVGVPVHAATRQQGTAGPLEQMLAQIADNEVSHTAIMYGSVADLEQVLGISINSAADFKKLSRSQQAAYLLDISGNQVYYSPFSGLSQPADWLRVYGIDPYQLQREAVVGVKPSWYAILQGNFQSTTVMNALTALGYKASPFAIGTVMKLGADNAAPTGQVASLAGSSYNRVFVTDTRILTAPSDGMMQLAVSPISPLTGNPSYAALVRSMEAPDLIANTQLISAALFGGDYLSNTLITADPLTNAVGATLSANEIAALRNKLKLDTVTLLPQYETAGIGYRRGAKARYWVISLVYRDAGTAQSAQDILTARLKRYGSFTQSGRTLFRNWKISGKLTTSADGLQIVNVIMQLPSQTDVSWTELITDKDLGFLAVQR